MKQLRRSDRIYQAVVHNTNQFSCGTLPETPDILRVSAIAAQAGISSNNASTELRQLFRQGLLLRVNSRPALYASIEHLEIHLHRSLPTNEFDSVDAFYAFLLEKEARSPSDVPHLPDVGLQVGTCSKFDELIGCGQSLQRPIEAVKAAILYPPHGLHTLITGETGVGKSQFVHCMYDYARRCGALRHEAQLVTFNCANYVDNPQLLMSQLFGYRKGAYTGATQDRAGLVEYADGGILFLDEIHRLHPEGQEKLFHLMDAGIFRRMGEMTSERHVQTLIVGATTESPRTCMLSTFLRRFSVHVMLPALAERSIQERLSLALYFIWCESQTMKRRVHLNREILSALVHYRCPGNIGQLQADIKLTCANVYFQLLSQQSKLLCIRLPHLSSGIQEGLYTSRGASSRLVNESLKNSASDIVVDGALPFRDILEKYLSPVGV